MTLSHAEVIEVSTALARYDAEREELEAAAPAGVVVLLARRATRPASSKVSVDEAGR